MAKMENVTVWSEEMFIDRDDGYPEDERTK